MSKKNRQPRTSASRIPKTKAAMDPPCNPCFDDPLEIAEVLDVALAEEAPLPVAVELEDEVRVDERVCVRVLLLSPSSPSSSESSSSNTLHT